MAEVANLNETVLAVFPCGEDHFALGEIFARSQWMLRPTASLGDAHMALHASSVEVVIVDGCLPDGRCWRDLLRLLQQMRNPPPLIVADRLADDRLWAEVLNLGGHDLLAKPFDAKEVLYAVAMACRRRKNQREMIALPAPPERNAHYPARAGAAGGGC